MSLPSFYARLQYFKTILRYDPEKGVFYWLEDRNSYGGGVKAGDIAGTKSEGRTKIGIDGRVYRTHILAWWFMTGEPVPDGTEIDHKDRNDNNNKWDNLRAVTHSVNNHNKNPPKSNKSGVRGVSWTGDKWDSRITVDNKIILLGEYIEFKDAVQARLDAELKYLGEITSTHAIGKTEPDYTPEFKDPGPDLRSLPESRQKIATALRPNNTSGHTGISLHPKTGRWTARGAGQWIGAYATKEEAIAAREEHLKKVYDPTTAISRKEYKERKLDGRTGIKASLSQATRIRKGNLSGVPGVSKTRSGRYSSKFRNTLLGTFDTFDEAVAARQSAMNKAYGV